MNAPNADYYVYFVIAFIQQTNNKKKTMRSAKKFQNKFFLWKSVPPAGGPP